MAKHNLIRTFAAGVLMTAAALSSVRAADVYNQTILNDKPVMFLTRV